MNQPAWPSREALHAPARKRVPDVIASGLKVLFCGINPGLYSATVGRHFARPGNRFWPALYAAGFTPRLFLPEEQEELLRLGLGITNLVERASASASELSADELRAGRMRLESMVGSCRPARLAVLGIAAYRTAFERPNARPGRQTDTIEGVTIWVLPNPSGLNAHYQLRDLVQLFRELRVDSVF